MSRSWSCSSSPLRVLGTPVVPVPVLVLVPHTPVPALGISHLSWFFSSPALRVLGTPVVPVLVLVQVPYTPVPALGSSQLSQSCSRHQLRALILDPAPALSSRPPPLPPSPVPGASSGTGHPTPVHPRCPHPGPIPGAPQGAAWAARVKLGVPGHWGSLPAPSSAGRTQRWGCAGWATAFPGCSAGDFGGTGDHLGSVACSGIL